MYGECNSDIHYNSLTQQSVRADDVTECTCITLVGVEVRQRGALWTGAGISTRPEQTEMAAHVLTGVGHWRRYAGVILLAIVAEDAKENYYLENILSCGFSR